MLKDSKQLNILIAEDENIIAFDIAENLKRLGYKVCGFARTSGEVVEKALKLTPDLILMDVMLDDNTSGIEAAAKINSLVNIPVVYLTALADSETLKRAKITEPLGYLLKPFEPRSLHTAIEMAVYKHNINSKLKDRTRELEEEKLKSEKLLRNILPREIIKELSEKGSIEPRQYKSITLLYTDFQDFTSIASTLPPQELVSELNDLFRNFDAIIDSYGLEKLKTIGDSYLVAGGLPKESDDHAIKIVNAALDMQNFLKARSTFSGLRWNMRAGIHSGSVIAGVVGKKKFTYDIWGDTVNTAALIEKSCLAGEINISETTYELVKDYIECDYNDSIAVYGKDKLRMYYVKRLINQNETEQVLD
jgi:class 3 adenylate cyclase